MADDVHTVELIASYARRSGDDIRVVLHVDDAAELAGPTVQLRLRGAHGGRALVPATSSPQGSGVVLEATAPGGSLKDDVYRIAVRPNPEAPFKRIQARLLTSSTQPVALLSGPAPRTRMQPPRPRPTTAPPVVRVGSAIVDKALSPLPAERAARYRSVLGGVARRIRRAR